MSKSQQELFDDLYAQVGREEFPATMKKIADVASGKTTKLRQASEVAHLAYCKADHAFNEQWKREWVSARDELLGVKE